MTIFFFLSGYLITWLLLREEANHGHFDLFDFYFRRAVRILPASFAFLFVLGGLAQVLGWPVSLRELLASGFFFRNMTGGSDHTGHYWTLASEEQFYLIWPVLLKVLPTRRRIPTLCLLVCAVPGLRMTLVGAGDGDWINWWRLFRANALLAGSLLALLKNANLIRFRWPALSLGLAAVALLGALLVPPGSAPPLRVASYVVELLAIGTALSVLVDGHCPGVQTMLAFRPVVYVGQLSYSLYLWQQIFCLRITGGSHEEFPRNLLFAFVAAMTSYHLIEKPCLRKREEWRDRLWPVRGRSPKVR